MTELEKRNEMPNVGGIADVYYVRYQDVKRISLPNELDRVTVELMAGKSWNRCYMTPKTIEFSEDQVQGAPGDSFVQVVKGVIPKDRSEVARQLDNMTGMRFVLKVQDKNGYWRLVGSLGSPARMNTKTGIGQTVAGRNDTEVTFERKSERKCFFL